MTRSVNSVRALAVALGVGAAVGAAMTFGGAVAWADDGGNPSAEPASGDAAAPSAGATTASPDAGPTQRPARGTARAAARPAQTDAAITRATASSRVVVVPGQRRATPPTPPTPDRGESPTGLVAGASSMAAWNRRDQPRTAPVSDLPARPTAAVINTAAVTAPTSLASTPLGWVTGQSNKSIPGWNWPQTNNTKGFGIYGTDLGIMWFNGVNGYTQLAFGDTFSAPNMTGDWRSNVLLLSDDTNLTDGLSLIPTGYAYQFIPAARNEVFFIGSEVTNIPTAAAYVNGENYVNYMSVKSWDTPGRWTTNYSAVSMYDDATNKWVLQRSTVRSAGWFRSSTPYVAGSQNFQQMAYVLEPESKVTPGDTRYLYAFGTPAGRAGSAFLSRVPETAVTDLGRYEYWDGKSWVLDKPAVAAAVLGDSTHSAGILGFIVDIANDPNFFGGFFAGLIGAKTGGNVSELSVQYNEFLDKYVVLYGNGLNNVVLRTADSPEGPWSTPVTIATSLQYPGLYAPMVHPLSGTGQLVDDAGEPDLNNLYWNMSLWGNYNVALMQTDLSPLNLTLA